MKDIFFYLDQVAAEVPTVPQEPVTATTSARVKPLRRKESRSSRNSAVPPAEPVLPQQAPVELAEFDPASPDPGKLLKS